MNLGLAARARTPRAAMPGVRAMATRHASGGCGPGVRVCGAGGRGAGEKKGARAGGYGAVAERGGTRAGG
jgi:hypothetical protein